MKRDDQYFREKMRRYYGGGYTRPSASTRKPSLAASIVLTRHFDDGRTLVLPVGEGIFTEYDIAGRALEFPDDYQVALASPQSLGTDLRFGSDFFVEPLDAPVAREQCACGCAECRHPLPPPENRPQPAPLPQPPAPPPVFPPDPIPLAQSKSATDDDFMADFQAILAGQKQYDPASRQTVGKDPTASPAPRRQPEPAAPDTKNEHEIFDRISQSMRFANAYDLGSVALEKRFDEFDELQEIRPKPSPPAKKPARTASTAAHAASVSTRDFIEDLDRVKKDQALTAAQSAAIPLDPGIGGRSIGDAALEAGDIILSTT